MEKSSIRARQNQLAFLGYSIICVIMMMTYCIEWTEGERTLSYMVAFSAFLLVPYLVCLFMYVTNQEDVRIKYAFLVGYLIHYTFIMFTCSTAFVYAYILPQCILFIIYSDWMLSIILSAAAFIINFANILYQNGKSAFTVGEISQAEIQLVVVLLQCIYVIFATRFFESLIKKNEGAEADINANEDKPLARQNRYVIVSYIYIGVVIILAYLMEVFKGNYTLHYSIVIDALVVIPTLVNILIYRKSKDSSAIKYVFSAGFLFFYFVALMTAQTDSVFSYVFLCFILVSIYSDSFLACLVGISSLFINLLQIVVGNYNTPFTNEKIVSAEIQVLTIIIGCILLVTVSRCLEKINEGKLKQLEAEREKAELANRSKSDFLSNMSHEIRTPLNAIIGMNEMILRETKDPDIFSYAVTAKNSSNALLALINDILDISKIEAGKIELEQSPYDISSVYVDSYNMVAERAKDKGLKLNAYIDPALPKTMLGDMTRVRQVFVNFLTNAVKYTEKGTVDMSLKYIKEGSYTGLEFVVADTGIGITPENVEKLFDKFERFDIKRNRNVEGTGLGMTITKEFVDMMNGSIDVESTVDVGSKFTVRLPQVVVDETPVGEVELSAFVEKTDAPYHHEKFTAPEATVLVVDDVESNHKVIRMLLKNTKIRVECVFGGKEALECAVAKKYDIIFMDHMMPDMDGIETLEHLKVLEGNKNGDTPILMLTANAIAGEREKYLAVGFNDYLTKPIHVEKLNSALLKYLPEEKIVSGESAATTEDVVDANTSDIAPEGLAAIHGMNLADGLKYCMNSEDFLKEMLSDYATNGREKKLPPLFANQDWENYRIEVHALKSTSRTVGLTTLGDMAEKQEHAVKNGDLEYVLENHEALMKEYLKILESIRGVL